MTVRVIALGSRTACDDEAALLATEAIGCDAEVILAGRPGVGVLDLLDPAQPTVLVDAVLEDAPPGTVRTLGFDELLEHASAIASVSSHGLGLAEALRLGGALGRVLPEGLFVGIVAGQVQPGPGLSPEVREQLPTLTRAIEAAVQRLERVS